MIWPDNKDFAFTIVDDTDHATYDNIKPIYDLLAEVGMRITKTIWVLNTEVGERFNDAHTLQDTAYLEFIKTLQNKGFEIALHGVRGASSERELILEGLEKYRQLLGKYPHIHINHAQNKDNLYWGLERIPKWKKRLKRFDNHGSGYGHRKDLPFYWGDFSKKHIKYIRGTVFKDINTLKADPFMPYMDKSFPETNQWFSSSDAQTLDRFNNLITAENISKLEKEKGLCIVYTHFGSDGFVKDGKVDQQAELLIRNLAGRNGWFVTASEILDYISKGKKRILTPWQKLILWRNYRIDQKRNHG